MMGGYRGPRERASSELYGAVAGVSDGQTFLPNSKGFRV